MYNVKINSVCLHLLLFIYLFVFSYLMLSYATHIYLNAKIMSHLVTLLNILSNFILVSISILGVQLSFWISHMDDTVTNDTC